jgi:hypothetical protein
VKIGNCNVYSKRNTYILGPLLTSHNSRQTVPTMYLCTFMDIEKNIDAKIQCKNMLMGMRRLRIFSFGLNVLRCIFSTVVTPHCKPWNSTPICHKRVGSGSTELNMLHLGPIQVRDSKETEKYKCASCGAYFTQLRRILPSGVEWEMRSGQGLQCIQIASLKNLNP